jgi:polyprenyl-phospho-N-acetylgalactosaminyl synthase
MAKKNERVKYPLDNSNIWIVIPIYNESTVINHVLDELCNKNYSIVAIDDCSSDNSLDIIKKYPIVVLEHLINLGQGASLQTGFDYVIKNTEADCVVTFDSDGQHNVNDIPIIVEPILSGKYDVVLGSRFLNKAYNNSGIPFFKMVTLKIGLLFTKINTGLKITDTHNGLRAFSIEALRKIAIKQNRMAHGSEILNQIAKLNLVFCEIPVHINYTEYSNKKGQSIFNALNIIWDLFLGREE